jgi:ABC-2 type transport system permease protein
MIKSISRKFYGYLKKDVLLLVRRKKHMYLFLALPFVIGLLFLFFLNPSPNNLKTVVCDNDGTSFSKEAVSNLNGFSITFLDSKNCVDEMISLIKKGKYSLGLEIPQGFSNNLDNLEQSRILVYYDDTDIALANLINWKVESSLAPFERTIINQLNNEVKNRVSSIRSGVDLVSDFSKSSATLNKRVNEIDSDLKVIENIDTEFILNPVWIDSKPLYDKQANDSGIAFVFPIIALFVVLMLSSTSIIYDRKTNFLIRVKSSTSPLVYLFAKLVFFFAITLVNFLIVFLLFIIYGSSFTYNIPQIINLVAFIAITNTIIGMFIGSISDNEGVAVLFSLIISLPFMLVSGIFYPIQTLPTFVQFLSKIMPMNYQIAYSKTVLLLGQSIGLTWIYVDIVLFGIVYYIIRKKN